MLLATTSGGGKKIKNKYIKQKVVHVNTTINCNKKKTTQLVQNYTISNKIIKK